MTTSIDKLSKAADRPYHYYQHESAYESYYNKSEGASGQWKGSASGQLKLNGMIEDDALNYVLRGEDPVTGMPLVKGAGDEHRSGWDLTLSAPKSVSVLLSQLDKRGQKRIHQAQQRAVESTLRFVEQNVIYVRRGHAGQSHEPALGMVAATYDHLISRAMDPQLHSHNLIANMAMREDGTWGAIESRYLYKWQRAIGAAYRSELAREMKKLGLEVELDGASFRLIVVPKDLEIHFSKRRQEILKMMEESGTEGAAAAERAALMTRSAKKKQIVMSCLYGGRRRLK